MACMAKLKVMNSQTGRNPACAAPTAMPVKPAWIARMSSAHVQTASTCTATHGSCNSKAGNFHHRDAGHANWKHLCDGCVKHSLCAILLQQPFGDLHAKHQTQCLTCASRVLVSQQHASHSCSLQAKHKQQQQQQQQQQRSTLYAPWYSPTCTPTIQPVSASVVRVEAARQLSRYTRA